MAPLWDNDYCHYCLRSSWDPLNAALCLCHVVSHLFKCWIFFLSHENAVKVIALGLFQLLFMGITNKLSCYENVDVSLLCDEYLELTLLICSNMQTQSSSPPSSAVVFYISQHHQYQYHAKTFYKSGQVYLLLLMTILHWSLNRINYPGEPSLLLLLRGHAHHPSPTFVTHRVICSQLASMATLKITPVNQSEKIRWLTAAACLPTTPPPPLSAAHS